MRLLFFNQMLLFVVSQAIPLQILPHREPYYDVPYGVAAIPSNLMERCGFGLG